MKRRLLFVLPVMLFWRVSLCFSGSIEISYNAGDGCQEFLTRAPGEGFEDTCVGTTLLGTTIVQTEASLGRLRLRFGSDGASELSRKFAQIRVRDTLTVTGGVGSGTLVFNWSMTGNAKTLTANGDSYAALYFSNLGGAEFATFLECGPNVTAPICSGFEDTAENDIRTIQIPFEFNVPLNLDWRLTAVLALNCTYFNSCGPPNYSAGGNVDFFTAAQSREAQLQPLIVLDSGGNQIFGASALSDSGFSYPVAGGPAPPVLGAIGNKAVNEGAMLVFDATATDSDTPDSGLTFSLGSGSPTGASITSAGHFSWIPTETQGPGSYPVTVQVADDSSPALSDSEQITIVVSEVNTPPVLAAIGGKSIKVGSLLTFNATATDPDLPTNTLTFSLAPGAPAGATINATTGVFSWQPSNKQGQGNYPVTIRVADNGSSAQSDSEAITISVLKKGGKP